jgi:hypothetical protein
LTFDDCRRRLHHVRPDVQLALFGALPERRQSQAWDHLVRLIDAAREASLAAEADAAPDDDWRAA